MATGSLEKRNAFSLPDHYFSSFFFTLLLVISSHINGQGILYLAYFFLFAKISSAIHKNQFEKSMAMSCLLCKNGVSLVASCLSVPASHTGGINI